MSRPSGQQWNPALVQEPVEERNGVESGAGWGPVEIISASTKRMEKTSLRICYCSILIGRFVKSFVFENCI